MASTSSPDTIVMVFMGPPRCGKSVLCNLVCSQYEKAQHRTSTYTPTQVLDMEFGDVARSESGHHLRVRAYDVSGVTKIPTYKVALDLSKKFPYFLVLCCARGMSPEQISQMQHAVDVIDTTHTVAVIVVHMGLTHTVKPVCPVTLPLHVQLINTIQRGWSQDCAASVVSTARNYTDANPNFIVKKCVRDTHVPTRRTCKTAMRDCIVM